MKLKCVESEVPWFVEGHVYEVSFSTLYEVTDEEGDTWYLSQDIDGWSLDGLDDATFEEVSDNDH